jgi:hypothetical protein
VTTTDWSHSPRAPIERSQLAREELLRHSTVFLNSTGTNATATLVKFKESRFFLLTAQHVIRIIEDQKEKWSYQNLERVVRYLIHPPTRTDLGKEALYSPDLTLLELHSEDAAEMVHLGLRFYDWGTLQFLSDGEYRPDYFIIGAPKSSEVLENRELSFEIRCVGVDILPEINVDGVTRFIEVRAIESDYSGMSGGGLWEISYPTPTTHSVFLVGVVVREPQQLQSTEDVVSFVSSATIQCSTRESITELVVRGPSFCTTLSERVYIT